MRISLNQYIFFTINELEYCFTILFSENNKVDYWVHYRIQKYKIMKAHSLKVLYPEPAQQEFGKICKIARRASVIKYLFNKLADVQ